TEGPDVLRKVLAPFVFIDYQGRNWRVEPGFATDGATIPRGLHGLVGTNWRTEYVRAAVFHDYFLAYFHKQQLLCQDPGDLTIALIHYRFRDALMASGVLTVRANAMYEAVSNFYSPPDHIVQRLRDLPHYCQFRAFQESLRLPQDSYLESKIEEAP